MVATAHFGLTVGLFGPWGTGKTTILEEVGRRLNTFYAPLVAYAGFDAWRYEGDSLRREFVREIVDQLVDAKVMPLDFNREEHLRSFDADVAESANARTAFEWRPLLVSLAAAVGAAAAIAAAYLALPLLDISSETVVKIELTLLGGLATFIFVALGRSIAPVRTLETRRRFEYPDQFARNFDDLLMQATAERIVIGIDNLDRCSPDRVEEILTAVKTFLEPRAESQSQRPLLFFVIAADDGALRRHLEAKEAALLGGLQGSGTIRRAQEIQDAVSDYLRKFFNAHIHIPEVLDEDMEVFAGRELEPFFAGRPEISQENQARLVELTSYGLKRNPRRVKQFVNDLALRLDLFDQRFGSDRIQRKPDVLAMAKLVMLEEEHPSRFRELTTDHSLLQTWHQAAAPVDAATKSKLGAEFVGFLQSTADIEVRDLAAYIKAKQTEAELALPRYGEFVGLIEDGNVGAVAALLEAEAVTIRLKYVVAAQKFYDDQRRSQAWARAHSALRCVVEVTALRGGSGSCVRHVLRTALENPLRDRLAELDTPSLLEAAKDALQEAEVHNVLDALLEGVGGAEPREDPSRVLEGLGHALRPLDDQVEERLRNALEGEDLAGKFSAYVSLAESNPGILGRTPLRLAFDTMRDDSSLGEESPAVRIALSACEVAGAGQGIVEPALDSLRKILWRLSEEEGDGYTALVSRISPMLPRAGDDVASGLVMDICEQWRNMEGVNHLSAARLGVEACMASTVAASNLGAELGTLLAGAGASPEVSAFVARDYAGLPLEVREGFRTTLGGIVGESGDAEGIKRALQAADALPSKDRDGVLTVAAEQAMATHRPDSVLALLDVVAPEEAEILVTKILDETEQGADQVRDWRPVLERLVENQGALDEGQLERLARAMIQAPRRVKKLFDLAPVIGRLEVADQDLRRALAEELIQTEKEFSAVDRRVVVLEGADVFAGPEDSGAATVVERRLEELEAGGSQDQDVARRVRRAREARLYE